MTVVIDDFEPVPGMCGVYNGEIHFIDTATNTEWYTGELKFYYTWLFVSPGRNFVFDPGIRPPTGRFFEEALRAVGNRCFTEEAIRYGAFDLTHIRCIHAYQALKGVTECKAPFSSTESCMGLVYSGERVPWIVFFSMGYWMDRDQRKGPVLHLTEANCSVLANSGACATKRRSRVHPTG